MYTIPMPLSLTAAADDDGRRLDRILRKALRDLPLSAIHRLLRQGCVRVNGETAAAARRIRAGETITVTDTTSIPSAPIPPAPSRARKLEILFEGSGLLVLNKPAGLAVHGEAGAAGPPAPHLAGQVLSYLSPKLPPSLSFKPGPLHRLDKPSSGVIAFSASLEGARLFSALMQEHKLKKFYLAIVQGIIGEAETWQDELSRDRNLKKTFTGGEAHGKTKTAITRVKALARNNACTLILAEIETGRSHQIRAQAAARGHPLLGDKKYGAKPFPKSNTANASRKESPASGPDFLLHAWRLEFPAGTPFPGLIEAPLPEYFRAKIRQLFGEDAVRA